MQNISLILFSSEAASMGVKSNADYSSSKAGLQGLISSLAPDVVNLHPRARVNAVAPGAVDTPQFRKECAEDPHTRWIESEATVAQKRAVPIDAVARTCLFLASDRFSSSITSQVIQINGGKGGKMFYLSDGSHC
jgi:NAD(P)-dependent dehydrogenase (short-subunit alcohol dehydrogenase family)